MCIICVIGRVYIIFVCIHTHTHTCIKYTHLNTLPPFLNKNELILSCTYLWSILWLPFESPVSLGVVHSVRVSSLPVICIILTQLSFVSRSRLEPKILYLKKRIIISDRLYLLQVRGPLFFTLPCFININTFYCYVINTCT